MIEFVKELFEISPILGWILIVLYIGLACVIVYGLWQSIKLIRFLVKHSRIKKEFIKKFSHLEGQTALYEVANDFVANVPIECRGYDFINVKHRCNIEVNHSAPDKYRIPNIPVFIKKVGYAVSEGRPYFEWEPKRGEYYAKVVGEFGDNTLIQVEGVGDILLKGKIGMPLGEMTYLSVDDVLKRTTKERYIYYM